MHDAIDHKRTDGCRLVPAVFELGQCRGSHGETRAILFVPLRDLGVQIPAVVIEACGVGDLADSFGRAPVADSQTDDDVGDLNAEIVDVVLDLHRHAAELEHASERVAERGIAKVTDVRGLVRIDRGVLDDGFLTRRDLRRNVATQPRDQECRPLEIEVQVPVGSGDDARHARQRPQSRDELLRDDARRLSKRSRQLERHGHRKVAKRSVGRRLDRE